MKANHILVISGFAGLVVGAGAMAVLRRPDYYGTEYPGMIRAVTAEHVLHAKLLREGRSGEVLRMIESTFPSSVLQFDMFNLRRDGDITQLWRIREHGEKHHIEYPAPVASMLANLPPKPPSFCDIEDERKKPNKAPEPTPPSVTPRASEGVQK